MDFEPEYLKSLNEAQKAAVVHSGSPLLILAGAGSGKTRVITTKIAYLIQHENVEPYSILAVTFTKKAAKEMQERAVALEPSAEKAQIRTFHSFGAWFLRRYCSEVGLEKSFTVYDDEDSVSLLMKAVPSLTKKQAAKAAHLISLAKDYCLGPEDDLSEIDPSGDLADLYRAYEKRLRATGNADFGDLIMLPVMILQKNEQIRHQMHYRFRVIMVDEYQDSNVAQFKLLQAISGVEENSGTYVCVVGDDDQSIYKFRGAEVQNILGFADQFPGTTLIKLEENYRSKQEILQTAENIVSHNSGRLGKTLIANRGEGKKPVLVFVNSQDDEAEFVAELIKKSVLRNVNKKGEKVKPAKYSDWAILYRTNAQSLSFESEFLHKKIPYVVVGSLKFYEREEIKDALAYLSLIANGRDEIAFRRIVNKPTRGIGEKSQDKIILNALATAGGLLEDFNLVNAAENCAASLPKKAAEGLRDFCGMMKRLRLDLGDEDFYLQDEVEQISGQLESTEKHDENENHNEGFEDSVHGSNENLSAFLEKVLEKSALVDYHKEQDELEGTQRVANLQELVNSAIDYPCNMPGLLDFLDAIELDRSIAEGNQESNDAVTLITIHNTKGLEFNRVVITGMENGIFPREDKVGSELEEERRLMYVGVTRAKNRLYLTSCSERRLYGHYERMMPSRFLVEAGDVFKILGKAPLSYTYANRLPSDDGEIVLGQKGELLAKWAKGVRVYSDEYGYGQVISSSAESGDVVIVVQFENGGQKRFMPEFQAKSLDIIKD